ncbi:MAG: phage tail protein [Oscillospiraceae bacterium]|nr:phage tail protein [Oscillospiraceae bacterium]
MIRVFDFNGVAYPLTDYTNFHITHKEDGRDVMTFCLDPTHEQYPLLQEEAVIRTDQNEYLIKKVDDDKIDCQLNFDFLKERSYYAYKSETRTLLAVLQDHLPTGWTIEGATVSTIRRTITFDSCTDYDVVYACPKTYGVRFIWYILEKRLVIVKPDLIGSTGEYLTTELNLVALSFKGQSTDFATRLYAYGKDGMTLEDAIINGSRYGLKYVDDNTYSSKLVIATWTDERYTIPENLYADAVDKLAQMAYPVRSYTCKVKDLAKLDDRYSFLTFTMFRKLHVLDTERKIAVEHQIVEYDEWPDEEDQNTVTLNCVQDTIYTRINEAIENGGQDAAEAVRQELEDFINGQYAADLEDIEEQLDGKAETWYQSADPSTGWTDEEKAEHVGDLWYKTTDNTTWRWNGTAWAQQNVPDAVFNKINGKAQVFVTQPTPPYNVGDLWVQGSTGDIKRCSAARASGSYTASDWTLASKYTDDSALTDWLTNTYASDKSDLQSQIDGKVQTYSQSADPATNWTADEKAAHVGDLWYNTTSQKYYRYNVSGSTYSWSEIKATPPASVVSTINSKAQIFTAQPTTPYNVGDLWFNSTNDDIMTCITARASGNFTATDWAKRNKYTDDTAADAVQDNLDDAVEYLEGAIEDGDSAVSASLAERLNLATAMLTAAFGSYFYSENGELFMMDNSDPSQAQIVWRWNVNGFGKSSTGIEGPYTTALTFDDTFITSVIQALVIRGDLIEANTISAEKIQQAYTDGVLSQAFTSAKGYVDALFTDLDTYLNGNEGQLTVLREDITDIQATIAGLNIDFSEAFRGGINYAHNSAGLNGLSDDWTKTGTVVTMQSSDTKNSTVSNSCFRMATDATLSQTIDTVVLGQPYTISCKVKKTGSLLSEVYVVYNGDTVGKLFSQSTATTGWVDVKFTIDAIASNTLQFVATTRSDYLYVSDVMVCEGVTSKAWTPAPDEIYTSGVNIDKRGITVYRSGTQEKTVISNEEFAGYNGETEIFSLNGDETRINNAIVRQQLRIEDTMFIPFEANGEKGLNVALID